MYTQFCKLNRVFALLLLIALSPLLLLVSILVFMFIDKKVLFIQDRVGKDQKIFRCYKFASMKSNGKYKGNLSSDKEEFRINLFGNFIRRYFVDELPQLINIVKGDMNFIGPRPHSVYDHELFKKQIYSYPKRHSDKPGITGLAQANAYNGPVKNHHQLLKRVSYDLLYIKKKNFLLDVQIILNTFFIPFLNKNKKIDDEINLPSKVIIKN